MTRSLSRMTSLAISLALLLTLSLVGTASAVEPVKRIQNAEQYALSLLNCTRSGGFVKADGTCLGRGSGKYSAYRKPLRLHKNISTKVAWPWARAMVVNNVCGHTIAGKPSVPQRFRNKGFRYNYIGENVGCAGGGTPKQAVLMTHRMMQAEKSSRGGHWKNIKNPAFKSVGIGVASRYGRTMIVWDFYGGKY